ncbi:hypothetical protein HDU99_004918, partial [Rhizoclosmatium hyalinum]
YPEKAPEWFKEMLEKKKKRKEEVGNFADIGKSNKGSTLPEPMHLISSADWLELFTNDAVPPRPIDLSNNVAFMAEQNIRPVKPRWCYDSRSVHITGERKGFTKFVEYKKHECIPIRVARGSTIEATGRGDVTLV